MRTPFGYRYKQPVHNWLISVTRLQFIDCWWHLSVPVNTECYVICGWNVSRIPFCRVCPPPTESVLSSLVYRTFFFFYKACKWNGSRSIYGKIIMDHWLRENKIKVDLNYVIYNRVRRNQCGINDTFFGFIVPQSELGKNLLFIYSIYLRGSFNCCFRVCQFTFDVVLTVHRR